MATIFAATESKVSVNGTVIEGVRSLEYRQQQARSNVYALGSAERIGMVSGGQTVEGRLKVASTSSNLNALTGDTQFQVIAILKQGSTQMTVTFDECYLLDKSFDINAGGHGEATYSFTATRMKEEIG